MPLKFSDKGYETGWISFQLGLLYWENWPETWSTWFPNPNVLSSVVWSILG